jgi:predicted AlkP superfamily phosphohydrolase/phosphomutase/tetratricopeptide (TPR) repeat protein
MEITMASRSGKKHGPRPAPGGPENSPVGAPQSAGAGGAAGGGGGAPGAGSGAPGDRGRRARRRRLLAAGVLLVLAGWAVSTSIVRVDAGERAFRCTVLSASAARLGPGRHVVLPFVQRLVRVPEGPIRAASSVKVRTREGIEMEVPFEVTARMDDVAFAAFLGARGRGGVPQDAARAAAAALVAEWGTGTSAESVVLGESGAEFEGKLKERLEGEGFTSVVLRLGRPRGAAEAVAAISARALRERMTDTKVKVAILGLDGADWEIIDPLIAKGQLPNLARLKARGAWGNMKTMMPWLSPLLWTSVATGKPPEEHGIVDFLVEDSKTGKAVPVSSRWRKVKALWNMFTDAGRPSAFIAWWATWPSEPVQGFMVSDRVAYSLFGFVKSEPERAGATWPDGYFQEILPQIVSDRAITLEDVRRFAEVTPDEFAALRRQVEADPKNAYREPVNHLTKIIASQRTYQAVALDILKRGQPDLFSIYYQGIDEVCHRFAHYMPPKMDMVTSEGYAKYHEVVDRYYRYQDQLLGEVLAKLSPDTVVFVLSDHGFQNGGSRPKDDPPSIEGKPGLWHRRYGILIVTGPVIKPGRLDTTSLLDVAPTVLYLTGLPVAEDMPGRVIREAIGPAFLARFPVRTLPSYEGVGRPLEENRPVVASSGADQEFIENLKSLGYVGGGAGGTSSGGPAGEGGAETEGDGYGQALVSAHINEAGLYLKNKDYARAQAAVDEALKAQPGFNQALLLQVEIAEAQKDYNRAIALARSIVDQDPAPDNGLYLKLGHAYRDSGRSREGIPYFEKLRDQRPDVPEIRSALGSVLLKEGRTQEAERELLQALTLNPALSDPLTELHTLYKDTSRMLTLEPIVRKGLELDDKSLVHLNWMGLIYEWKRDLPRAEQSFKRALEIDPDYAPTMANLGALYGRNGRLQEAVDVLSRAVAKDPDNLESWVNLGAAQGRLGRSREAISALETAKDKGARTPTLYNALALSYLQDHQQDKAVQYLKESLLIDPDQKDAVDLLRKVSSSSR